MYSYYYTLMCCDGSPECCEEEVIKGITMLEYHHHPSFSFTLLLCLFLFFYSVVKKIMYRNLLSPFSTSFSSPFPIFTAAAAAGGTLFSSSEKYATGNNFDLKYLHYYAHAHLLSVLRFYSEKNMHKIKCWHYCGRGKSGSLLHRKNGRRKVQRE